MTSNDIFFIQFEGETELEAIMAYEDGNGFVEGHSSIESAVFEINNEDIPQGTAFNVLNDAGHVVYTGTVGNVYQQ